MSSQLVKRRCSCFVCLPLNPTLKHANLKGAATAQGAQKVAEKLIVSYTKIKRRAGDLLGGGGRKGATGGEGGGEDHVTDPGSESDWDLDLALTTVEFNKAKLERIRLMGSRCVYRDECVLWYTPTIVSVFYFFLVSTV